MADNLAVTAGSGSTIGMDEVVDGTLGTVKVGFGKIMDGTLDSTNKLIVNSSGEALVKDTAGEASLASIDGKITAVNTGAVVVSSSALPTGASTAAKQPALGTAGTASADVITVQGIASMTALKVDGSAVTQPVSGTVTANLSATDNTVLDNIDTSTASTATNTTNIPNVVGTAASAIPSKLLQVGGSDGTNARAIKTNTSGQLDVRPLTSSDVVSASNLPTTVDTNSGNKSASTLRVVLATDQPQLTNKLLVTPDANSAVNLAQLAGNTISSGVGSSGTGTLRVVGANNEGKTIVSKGGSASSSGDNTLVAAGTNKLKVFSYTFTTTSTTALTVKITDGASGTVLWQALLQAPTSVNVGATATVTPPSYLFATSSATALVMNLSSANAVHYSLSYYDEA